MKERYTCSHWEMKWILYVIKACFIHDLELEYNGDIYHIKLKSLVYAHESIKLHVYTHEYIPKFKSITSVS